MGARQSFGIIYPMFTLSPSHLLQLLTFHLVIPTVLLGKLIFILKRNNFVSRFLDVTICHVYTSTPTRRAASTHPTFITIRTW